MSDFTQQNDLGPASGGAPQQFDGAQQGEGAGYDQMTNSADDTGMGGGQGVHGSGVAGGYGGQSQSQTQTQSQPAEKQDWLDKGLEMAGKKAGYNLSDANADKIGDFANKEFKNYEGRGIPGVQ
ncbi:hypothetical protein BC835DRAFT_1398696 [Cytidiella melzeri]|nr:hypothetical protein BC835DRAFT_1398696 [Cytidiella melzeri]